MTTPLLCLAILARDAAPSLPLYLACLLSQSFPQSRTATNLPISAPLLRHIDFPSNSYANFHAAITPTGYFAHHPLYHAILSRAVPSCSPTTPRIYQVPVVHCSYLIRSDVFSALSYLPDGSQRHEYVLFSESARSHSIPQSLNDSADFGRIALPSTPSPAELSQQLSRAHAWIAQNS